MSESEFEGEPEYESWPPNPGEVYEYVSTSGAPKAVCGGDTSGRSPSWFYALPVPAPGRILGVVGTKKSVSDVVLFLCALMKPEPLDWEELLTKMDQPMHDYFLGLLESPTQRSVCLSAAIQKVRWCFDVSAYVYVIYEPMVGVDVPAAREIRMMLHAMRQLGKRIIVVYELGLTPVDGDDCFDDVLRL